MYRSTGQIQALNDVWIIGDSFVNEVYHVFQKMRDDARMDRRPLPYMYQQYNVACYTPNPKSVLKDVLARLVNCFIKALNNAKKLPRLVLVIPKDNRLKFINNNNFGVKMLSNRAISWVMTQMARALESKKENLQNRCPGSVISTETKMIWVEMFNRVTDVNKFLAVRYKYNEAMQEQVHQRIRHYIVDINDNMMDASLFNLANRLNGKGIIKFWNAIDKQIEAFDKREISLKPRLRQHQIHNIERNQEKKTEDKKHK